MICPPYLKPGDTVRILSTARKISREAVDAGAAVLMGWGLKVEYGKHLFSEYNQYAGTDEERIADMQDALDDPNCKAIFCARGGYGSVRLIDHLDFSQFHKLPKWIIGYSDVTVFHSHLSRVLETESIHGSMILSFPKNSERSLEHLRKAVFGERLDYEFAAEDGNRKGRASGEVIGGNLSILYSLMGSRSFPSAEGKILFIEDLDEYLYHVDRMMMGLKRAGLFDKLKGVVVGGMTDMNDNEIPFGKTAKEIIADVLSDYEIPVAYGFPGGHLDDNNPLIMGRKAVLEVGEDGSSLRFNS